MSEQVKMMGVRPNDRLFIPPEEYDS